MRYSLVLLVFVGAMPGIAVELRSSTAEMRSTTRSIATPLVGLRKGPTVYLSKHDTRFHSATCPRLVNPERSLSMDHAMLEGFGPCPRCSREILEQTAYKAPRSRRARRSSSPALSHTLPTGPPYIAIVRPQHRTVGSFPRIGY